MKKRRSDMFFASEWAIEDWVYDYIACKLNEYDSATLVLPGNYKVSTLASHRYFNAQE